MGLNVFGDKPLQTFVEPSPDDREDFRIGDHEGATVILQVVGVIEKETKHYGVKPAIQCSSIVVLDGKGNGKAFADVLLFQSAPVSQLRGFAGQTLAAKVVSYPTRQGGTAYKFDTPDPAGQKAAEAYLASA